MVGCISGFFSGIYMRTLHLKINKSFVYDNLGLYGPFLISSLLGSFVLAPALLLYYANNNVNFLSIGNTYPYQLAGWQLTYVGVSAGTGIVCGLVCGLFSACCDKDYYMLASNSRYFLDEFGLYNPDEGLFDLEYRGDTEKNFKETNE